MEVFQFLGQLATLDFSYKAFATRFHDGVGSKTKATTSRKIENRSRDGCYGDTLVFDDIVAFESRAMDFDPRRRTTTEPSARRNREVDRRRVRVGKTQDRKGCLMGKCRARASMRLSPENRFTVRGERVTMGMGKSVNAARKALQPAALDHTGQRSATDASVGGGPGGHEAFILGCEFQKSVEMAFRHGQNVTMKVPF
jgi:hypothetical protein